MTVSSPSTVAEKAKIRSFTDLVAWKESHVLVLMVYRETRTFPKEEMFGLVNQLRRAAVSITSNIAEGFSRISYAEKIHFYSIALGSSTEVQNQLLIARDVEFLPKQVFEALAQQSVKVNKLINGLIKSSRSFLIPDS
jgi:four helix bundle protein